jgi:hypothetical protein
MARAFSAILALLVFTFSALASLEMTLVDDFDDYFLVRTVSDQKAVRLFRKDLDEFKEKLRKMQEVEIEKRLGGPVAWRKKTYALPVAQEREIALGGLRFTDSKRHTSFYAVSHFGGVEVWYSHDGETPEAVIVYLKVDNYFPKLTSGNLEKRLAWDRERFTKLMKFVEERE